MLLEEKQSRKVNSEKDNERPMTKRGRGLERGSKGPCSAPENFLRGTWEEGFEVTGLTALMAGYDKRCRESRHSSTLNTSQ